MKREMLIDSQPSKDHKGWRVVRVAWTNNKGQRIMITGTYDPEEPKQLGVLLSNLASRLEEET